MVSPSSREAKGAEGAVLSTGCMEMGTKTSCRLGALHILAGRWTFVKLI